MHASTLTRRQALLLAIAALFAFAGVLAAVVTKEPPLDRDGLARLAAGAAAEPTQNGAGTRPPNRPACFSPKANPPPPAFPARVLLTPSRLPANPAAAIEPHGRCQ